MSFQDAIDEATEKFLELEKELKELKAKQAKLEESEIDWHRVVEGGYLVRVSDDSQEDADRSNWHTTLIDYVPADDYSFKTTATNCFKYASLYKGKGVKIPHFGNEMPEEIKSGKNLVYFRNGGIEFVTSDTQRNWKQDCENHITDYIIL